ncbi:ATP-binding protein, partial [Enterobacter hormaechei subsp. steigerwaltii]|nr:ATP-binding protein [Enterobacter hormaechei subsp. steigerwaltii]
TGLGLVITQKLVNEMGGDISFHSQPNRGSTFWFHINLDLNPNIIIEGPSTQCLITSCRNAREAARRTLGYKPLPAAFHLK